MPFKITKWWDIYTNINAYHSTYKGNVDAGMIDIHVTSYSLYMVQTFSFLSNYTAEITGYYDGPSVWQGTLQSSPMGGIDIGIQKKLFHNKADIKLSCTDLLNTMHWRGISNYNGSYINASGNWESHLIKFSFTYHFGNSQLKTIPEHHTGSEEENKRTGSSGGLRRKLTGKNTILQLHSVIRNQSVILLSLLNPASKAAISKPAGVSFFLKNRG